MNTVTSTTFKTAPMPVTIFISYAHFDETLRDDIIKCLAVLKRENLIEMWHDRCITAGTEWARQLSENLATAEIILLLISNDFIVSDYCYDEEMKRALERHEAGSARVIPIILRACDWKSSPFAKLQALPRDGIPVMQWPNKDEALLDIVRGIRKVLSKLRS